jgi:hypothetical protein
MIYYNIQKILLIKQKSYNVIIMIIMIIQIILFIIQKIYTVIIKIFTSIEKIFIIMK